MSKGWLKSLDFSKFDGFEIGVNVLYEEPNGELSCDYIGSSMPPKEHKTLHCSHYVWTVYGHFPEGGVECLCDCAMQEEAEDFMTILDFLRVHWDALSISTKTRA